VNQVTLKNGQITVVDKKPFNFEPNEFRSMTHQNNLDIMTSVKEMDDKFYVNVQSFMNNMTALGQNLTVGTDIAMKNPQTKLLRVEDQDIFVTYEAYSAYFQGRVHSTLIYWQKANTT
jgi:hypothetical protein